MVMAISHGCRWREMSNQRQPPRPRRRWNNEKRWVCWLIAAAIAACQVQLNLEDSIVDDLTLFYLFLLLVNWTRVNTTPARVLTVFKFNRLATLTKVCIVVFNFILIIACGGGCLLLSVTHSSQWVISRCLFSFYWLDDRLSTLCDPHHFRPLNFFYSGRLLLLRFVVHLEIPTEKKQSKAPARKKSKSSS